MAEQIIGTLREAEVALAQGKPVPPGFSKQKCVRYIDIYHDTNLDEALMAEWVRQASSLPGWEP